MYTGTSIALAMPDTSRAFRWLPLSTPSVTTTTARRGPPCATSRRPVCAIASYSEVEPNGRIESSRPDHVCRRRRERLQLFQPRVEHKQGDLVVARLEPAHEMPDGVARGRQLLSDVHAAADIEEDGNADRRRLRLKVGDRPPLARVEELEVRARQVGHRPAVPVRGPRRSR